MMGHRDALTADFQRYYGLDFDRLGCGLTVRRAAALAVWLPYDAAIWRALDPRAEWDLTQQLLANISDNTAFLAWTKTPRAAHRGARWDDALKRPGYDIHKKQPKSQILSRSDFDRRLAAAKRKYAAKR